MFAKKHFRVKKKQKTTVLLLDGRECKLLLGTKTTWSKAVLSESIMWLQQNGNECLNRGASATSTAQTILKCSVWIESPQIKCLFNFGCVQKVYKKDCFYRKFHFFFFFYQGWTQTQIYYFIACLNKKWTSQSHGSNSMHLGMEMCWDVLKFKLITEWGKEGILVTLNGYGYWCQMCWPEYFSNWEWSKKRKYPQLCGWKCLGDIRGQRRMGRLEMIERQQ